MVSATAVLDRDAVEAVGDLDRLLARDDLTRAGWTVAPVVRRPGGGAVVRASHPFSNPSQVAPLVRDLAGDGGAFSGVSVRQRRSFFKTSTSLRGQVDLEGGLGSFADPSLVAALRGSEDTPLGVTEDHLLEGRPVAEVFGFDLVARLPGRDTVRWHPVVGGAPVSIVAAAQQWNVVNVGALAVVVVGVFALVAVRLRYRA